MEPREQAERAEGQSPPPGADERFQGYGVMGETFASGHVLAMRRFPATSLGAGYTSLWHRDPAGAWTVYADAAPMNSCARYFGNDLARAIQCEIELSWPGPRSMRMRIPSAALSWDVALTQTAATRAMNLMARALPDALWKDRRVLAMMARVAGPALRAGRLAMHGHASNGQTFVANPMVLWAASGPARIGDADLGAPAPLAQQARLGDFWIPQRGLFAFGRAFFETYDAARHLAVASREQAGG